MGVDRLLNIDQAAAALRSGGVIAYPTEAVYGLGCDPRDESAVRAILELKSRPEDAGLILIADSFQRFMPFVAEVTETERRRAAETWPGPVTWLFPRAASVPDWLAGRHPTIALRVTDHPGCRALCAAFEGAIVSTSANPAGDPPARSAKEVQGYFEGRIDGVLKGSLGSRELCSEIRDLATGRVLRGG
jgi:L-threonylcarbamoyladenylate synthase